MLIATPLLSLEGYSYIRSLIAQGINHETYNELIHALALPFRKNATSISATVEKRVYKNAQHQGVLDLMDTLGTHTTILEVGCGTGSLAARIAANGSRNVLGIDANKALIERARDRYGANTNLSFQICDAFSYTSPRSDLVVALHACGTLTDRCIDFALNSRADIIVVPCCYGLYSRSARTKAYDVPRSATLALDRESFLSDIVPHAARHECVFESAHGSTAATLRDIYRLLVNFDRLLYLKEHGYSVAFTPISEARIHGHRSTHRQSSLRHAIVGLKKSIQ